MTKPAEVLTGTVRHVSVEYAEDIGRCTTCYGLLFPGERVEYTGEYHTLAVSVWLDNDRQLIVHQQIPKLKHVDCNDTLGVTDACLPKRPAC